MRCCLYAPPIAARPISVGVVEREGIRSVGVGAREGSLFSGVTGREALREFGLCASKRG